MSVNLVIRFEGPVSSAPLVVEALRRAGLPVFEASGEVLEALLAHGRIMTVTLKDAAEMGDLGRLSLAGEALARHSSLRIVVVSGKALRCAPATPNLRLAGDQVRASLVDVLTAVAVADWLNAEDPPPEKPRGH